MSVWDEGGGEPWGQGKERREQERDRRANWVSRAKKSRRQSENAQTKSPPFENVQEKNHFNIVVKRDWKC